MRRRPSSRWMQIVDRLDLAEAQLRMVREDLGFISPGHVRQACYLWADDGNREQYESMRETLMELVTT